MHDPDDGKDDNNILGEVIEGVLLAGVEGLAFLESVFNQLQRQSYDEDNECNDNEVPYAQGELGVWMIIRLRKLSTGRSEVNILLTSPIMDIVSF